MTQESNDVNIKEIDFYKGIYESFNRTNLALLPPPRVQYIVFEPSLGYKVAAIVGDNEICEPVPLQHVVDSMMEYTREVLRGYPDYQFTHRKLIECARYWLSATKPISAPKAVRLASEKGYCFARLPFDIMPNPEGALCPTWNELMGRMSDSEVVMAWIGSLFIDQSYSQQYLWLYGAGHDGKGSLARFLMKCFGNSACQQSNAPNENTNKHWAVPYENKRLIIYSDFTDTKALGYGALKCITGGDAVYIDPKGKAGYTSKLNCKLLFLSNEKPELDDTRANMRRLIFAHMQTTEAHDDGYEDRLMDEGGYFIGHCIEVYNRVCGKHLPIPFDNKTFKKLEAQEFEEMFECFAELDPNFLLSPKDLEAAFYRSHNLNRGQYIRLVKWLESNGHIQKVAYRNEFGVNRAWKGIRLR